MSQRQRLTHIQYYHICTWLQANQKNCVNKKATEARQMAQDDLHFSIPIDSFMRVRDDLGLDLFHRISSEKPEDSVEAVTNLRSDVAELISVVAHLSADVSQLSKQYVHLTTVIEEKVSSNAKVRIPA